MKLPSKKRLIETRVIKCRGSLSSSEVQECVTAIQFGGVVIFPTDTVYGMACNPFNVEAVNRVYRLKGRNYSKPLPIFLRDPSQLHLVAKEILKEIQPLVNKFWPGPLTLIFKTAPLVAIPAQGRPTIAVRVPDHGPVRQILDEIGIPLAVTSANLSGKKSAKKGQDVIKAFNGKVDLIIDAGRCPLGVESSIVDATHYPFTVLRERAIPKAHMLDCLNRVKKFQ